jgi:cyclase
MQGYDIDLVENVRKKCNMPITVLGGAGTLIDIQNLISKFKIIGAAAGSLFVFKGKYRAVLINYPNRQERKPLYK